MKHFYSVLGREITKDQYVKERERLYNESVRLDLAKRDLKGNMMHHLIACEFIDDEDTDEYYLMDDILNDEKFKRFVETHKSAYIFARHSR